MAMCLASIPKPKFAKGKQVFLVSPTVAPQTIAVLGTRASGFAIELKIAESNAALEKEVETLGEERLMGSLVQYPDVNGDIGDWSSLAGKVKAAGGKMVVASDLLALTMLKPPGEWGADIVCGNSQRFGESIIRLKNLDVSGLTYYVQVCRQVMAVLMRLSSRVRTS
jgi:glycine dehydrogenase